MDEFGIHAVHSSVVKMYDSLMGSAHEKLKSLLATIKEKDDALLAKDKEIEELKKVPSSKELQRENQRLKKKLIALGALEDKPAHEAANGAAS